MTKLREIGIVECEFVYGKIIVLTIIHSCYSAV